MRIRSLVAVLAGAVGMVTAPLSPVAAVPPVAITAITVDSGPFSVDGLLGSAPANVSISITSPDDVGRCSAGYPDTLVIDNHVVATLTRTSGGPVESVLVYLTLASGSLSSGTWTGAWNIGATRGGTWTLSRVSWCYGLEEFRAAIDPRAEGFVRTVRVEGTHVPRVTSFRTPVVAEYGARQSITFTFYGSSGNLLRNRPTTLGQLEYGACGTFLNGNTMRSTNDRGQLTLITVPTALNAQACVYFANPQQAVLGTFDTSTLLAFRWASRYEYYRAVSATTSVDRLAKRVTVSGSVYPRYGTVQLQRRGSTSWRTVSSANVRASGRYTLTTALVTSCATYRVVASQAGRFAPTPSRTFVVYA